MRCRFFQSAETGAGRNQTKALLQKFPNTSKVEFIYADSLPPPKNTKAKKNRNKKKSDLSGTGFKYIKARLNESYGSNWHFDSFVVEEGWCTTIKIFDK